MTAQLPEASADQADKRVQLRMERQARLSSDDPLRLWVILGEPALRYQVGGLPAMREQLQRLLEVGDRPHTQYTLTYEHLRAAASSREQSRQLIKRALQEV